MLGTRVFRVFVSSTFRDLKAERDALQEKVFPELRAHCAARGYAFQAVDLRWGIREEASAGQRTMRICLSEVARCQEVSPRPNFVVLLGDRYGWRPLPEVIDACELKTLRARLAPAALAALEAAYDRDDNAVPPQYVLAPRREGGAAYDADVLRKALADAARGAGLPDAARAKYTLSATEQEILKGAFEAENAGEHVFCFLRDLSRLPDRVRPSSDPELRSPAADYRDFRADGSLDSEAGALLEDLKTRLRERLGDSASRRDRGLGNNLFEYRAEWTDAASSTDHIDRLCADMLSSLTRVIDDEIERLGAYSHLDRERAAHAAFAAEHAGGFIGRERYLDAIARYLAGGDENPLCVFAAGGLGKSALVARAATDAARTHTDAVIVTRFIGVTSASADPRSLLQDLCGEIGGAYGSGKQVPSTLQDLQQEFPRRLKLASAERPLIIFLDSLDQLVGGEGMDLPWLPSDLPGSVRLVTATRPGPRLDGLASRLPENLVLELDAMPPDEGEILLDSWLQNSGRKLRPPQRAEILARFGTVGSPLYLRLAFEEARLWPSALQDVRIGADEAAIIGGLYERLEAEHGAELVGHALGFLACTYARLGISEDELLDALAADEETWAEFRAGSEWETPLRQLPVVVWTRLYFDLAPYLSPRASEGASLLSFFHKELADEARKRYVEGRRVHLHDVLADAMHRLARGRDAGERDWKGGAHALAELPFHLTRAERWHDLSTRLTDFTYLEQKARRVAVVTAADADGNGGIYNGVLALVDDFDRALAAFPAEQAAGGSPTTARSDQRPALEAFATVLVREAHNLARFPDLLWQQLYNRLQWADGPGEDGVVTRVLAPELEERSKPGAGLWLHSLARPLESDALIRTLSGHTDGVNAVACSPDGRRIVSGSDDQTLKVWDAASGVELATLGHSALSGAAHVEAVAWSPDGSRIVSGSFDNTQRIWDAASGETLATLSGQVGAVRAVAWSPDGTRVVSCSDKTLKVQDAASGYALATFTGHTDIVRTVAYSPNGRRIASGSDDRTLRVWDAATGRTIATLKGHKDWVRAVAYSPDGNRILSGDGSDDRSRPGRVRVWDAASGAPLATLSGSSYAVNAVAYSPDGTRIVAGCWGGTLKVWDATSGAELATLSGHTGSVNAVAYSPDGTRIVSGAGDKTLKLWDAASAAEVTIFGGRTGSVNAVAYSPDGTRVVSCSDRTLNVWDAAGAVTLATLSGHTDVVRAVACSPDGSRIASGAADKTLRIWDAATGRMIATLNGHKKAVNAVAYSPDGARIVSCSDDKMLKIWDSAAKSRFLRPPQALATLNHDPGQADDVEEADNLWDAFAHHDLYVQAVAYSPDGGRIVSGSGNDLRIWDAASGAKISAFGAGARAVAYSPDGARIVSGSGNDLRIWDAASGALLATLRGHTDWVRAVAYSKDGRRLVSGSDDRTLKVWDAEKMECDAILPCLGSVHGCDYSPQGSAVCCGDASGTVSFVELMGLRSDFSSRV